jgi:signal transduction histidine kinase
MDIPTPRNFKGKLRNKIFLFMALIGIVPLIVAAVLTEYVVTNSHRDDVAKLESAVLQQKGSEVQTFINQDILTQTRVEIPYGGNIFSTSSIPAQQYVLNQTLTLLPFIQSEEYINLQGQVTAQADNGEKGSATSVASSSSVPAPLPDMSASPAFQAAKAGNDYLGPISYPNNIPTILFASPVTSGNETIGVIAGVATLGQVQSIVSQAQIGTTGYLYLVDQNGNVIGGGGSLGSFIGSSTVANLNMVQAVLAGNSALTAATQQRYKNVAGQEVVAAGEPLSEGGATWGLIAEWPTSESDAVINSLLVRDVIILLIVLGLIILLSIVLALIIARPIKKLKDGTARVAQGKFNEGVSITTGDELEELGDSFNTMVLGLKELEQLKDEFVFIAAHELRTPVAAMKGYLTLILEGQTGGVNDQTKVFIEKVLGSNQRLIQLVNDLLEVARSQAGRLTIKVAPIDIRPSLHSVLDELKSLADEKSIKMFYELPADLPNVLADGDRIKEVGVNLVGNSIKYMGDYDTRSAAGGTITISHEVKDKFLITRFADTGLGISKEAQVRLFEKFYRVQTDKTRDITGTGLGLFIVREIIEKMDGTISVESEEGKGTTFTMTLPIAK